MPKVRLTITALCVAVLGIGLQAVENWSRFRGPNGTGVSSATNLPVEFGPESHVKWKTPLPPGHSSPVFTNTHIFLTAHSPEKDSYKLFTIASIARRARSCGATKSSAGSRAASSS